MDTDLKGTLICNPKKREGNFPSLQTFFDKYLGAKPNNILSKVLKIEKMSKKTSVLTSFIRVYLLRLLEEM